MNMRCRSPEQHKSRGTANSHTGNSTSASLRTTSSPSSSSVCRRGGERQGALWFPVLWVILPHPAPVVPLCVFHVLWVIAPAPPRLLRQEAWWEGGGIPWGTSTVTWMTCACLLTAGGGGGAYQGGGGACDAERGTIYIIYIYIYGSFGRKDLIASGSYERPLLC